jgi:HK97 family phage major capsid protein
MSHALKAAVDEAVNSARAIAERAESENRPFTEAEQAEFTAHFEKARDVKRTLTGFMERKGQLADLASNLGYPDEPVVIDERQVTKSSKDNRRYGLGEEFTSSEEYRELIKYNGGHFSEKTNVQSRAYRVKAGLITGTSDTSAGGLVQSDYRGMLSPTYARPLSIRQLVTNGNTSSDTIEYVQLNTVTNNAAPVAEATTDEPISATAPIVTPVQGGLKPQSTMDFIRHTTNVKTIAHWLAITKRALADASQMQTLIDTFLRSGLEEELEDQMISGDGTGENFLGLKFVSGVQLESGASADVTSLEAFRRARTKVQIGGRAQPSAYVLSPVDWQKVELLRDSTGNFYGNGPFALGPNMLWGLPVVTSEALPAGTAYCADWRQAVLYDREQATIQASSDVRDFFIRNLVAILAELRAAFAVLRPPAFVRITLT